MCLARFVQEQEAVYALFVEVQVEDMNIIL